MKNYPIVRIVHGRRKSLSDDQEKTVEIEISFDGKRKWISTGVRVLSKNWRDGKKVIGRADAIDMNLRIEHLENSILNFIRKQIINKQPFTWSVFETFLESNKSPNTFVDFVGKRVSERKDIQNSTRRNHKKFFVALKDFGRIQKFEDLTRQNIALYDQWLHARKDYVQSTIASYHKYMKVYINEAIRMELIIRNPYEGLKIDQGKPGKRKFLEMDELSKIILTKMPTSSLERVQDLFIFQCFTGLSYSDMRKFDFNNVVQRGEKYIIHDVRKKTGEDFYIVLLQPAMEVLKKYEYKLPIISNEQYNLRLKLVATYAGIDENLTSHMGRHTFATMSLNSGVKIEVLAQMMGHSDIKTTQIYAKMVNQTVEDAYEVLEKKLQGNKALAHTDESISAPDDV